MSTFFSLLPQQARADSIPPFSVLPDKALRNGQSGKNMSRLVDVSAQIVVLDGKAKQLKQVTTTD